MKLLQYAVTRPVVINAFKVALVVGTCLNAINQGPQLWHGEGVVWSRIALNFFVPYLVASYSGAKALVVTFDD